MLSNLEIKNFKGIKEGTIGDLAQVNVLVGRNNSGKSTVLDALLLMRCAFGTIDYVGNDGFSQLGKRRIDRETVDFRELHYQLNTDEHICLGASFANEAKVVQDWEPSKGLQLRMESTTTKERCNDPR